MTHRGFTLIELLVVITIIAVLAGILLPTISMVRMQSTKTKFSSNLRQIGIASIAYAGDNEDLLPCYFMETPPTNQRRMWMDFIGPFTDEPARVNPSDVAGSSAGWYHSPMYGSDTSVILRSIFHDPIDKTACTTAGIPGLANRPVCNVAYVGTEYYQASTGWVNIQSQTNRTLSSIGNISEVGLAGPGLSGKDSSGEFGDASRLVAAWMTGKTRAQCDAHLRYRKSAPFVFADGHVESKDSAWWFGQCQGATSTSKFFDWNRTN
jgi:prepilin-type N-terminal cleavage/methylation domain-containing protein/prepilin-type processing-associated H-X9-DG protein